MDFEIQNITNLLAVYLKPFKYIFLEKYIKFYKYNWVETLKSIKILDKYLVKQIQSIFKP